MKTNIIKYISMSVGALMLFAGCNKLDQGPTNKFTDDAFWTSAARAELVLNMAYRQMYGNGNMWSDEYLSDNMISRNDRNPDERQIRSGQGNSTTGKFASEWQGLYGGIKTTNVFMDKIDLVPAMDPVVKAEMIAQIRFIRAYLYFRLSNFYGAIPFFLGDITLEESKVMGRTPRTEVLAALHTELDQIIPALPKDVVTADRGAIRKAAAVMLKARMYMYEGKMAEVASWTKRLIDGEFGTYALFNPAVVKYSAYEDLFTSANEYNSEIILCYASVPLLSEWNLSDKIPFSVVGSVGAYYFPTESLVAEYTDLNGNPYTVTGNDAYADRDPRLDATVVRHKSIWNDTYNGNAIAPQTINIDPADSYAGNLNEYLKDNATGSGYYLRKWFDPAHRADMVISTNTIMMRYADVLLMYAEAMNETTGLTQEVWDLTIKPIRMRAGFTATAALEFPIGKSKDDLTKIVRRERRCELALEGLRYYDIIRWKEGKTLLDGTLLSAKFRASTKQDEIFRYKFDNNKDMLWAVPQSQITNWPALKPQNPGY